MLVTAHSWGINGSGRQYLFLLPISKSLLTSVRSAQMFIPNFMAGPICGPLVSSDNSVEHKHICNTNVSIMANKQHKRRRVSHPHGCRYPGKKAGNFGVDAGFLGHGTASPPAHNSEQTIPAGLGQTVLCHKRAAAVSLCHRLRRSNNPPRLHIT